MAPALGCDPGRSPRVIPRRRPLPGAQFRATRAISIDAPPEAVWPWLVQVGCLRAGWYSNDLLDNLAHPSATTLIPDLQRLELGQWVPMSPTPSERTALKVHSSGQRLVAVAKHDSTWLWKLTPADSNQTRLVTRIHASYDWSHRFTAVLGVALIELATSPCSVE